MDYVEKYGLLMPGEANELEAECLAYLHGGNLGQAAHFKNICRILWGPDNESKEFVWYDWPNRMLEACLENSWVGLSGGASGGKTDFASIWAIVNFICAPEDTQVIVLSTTIEQSKKRIWGAITSYWLQAKYPLPGKALGKTIRIWDGTTAKHPDNRGITLFAGEKKKEKQAAAQLIGIKAPRVFMIADEHPELSEAIVEAAETNIAPGNPSFSFLSMGNHKSTFDPFGTFTCPVDGWPSVTVEDDRWKTRLGVCEHFDALRHPNVEAQQDTYPGIQYEKVEKMIGDNSSNSPGVWRMLRSFPCPTGETHALYSEPDLYRHRAFREPIWVAQPIKLAALDLSFASGGDRTIAYFGLLGREEGIGSILHYQEWVELYEDVTNKKDPRDYQIANLYQQLCEKRGIPIENTCYDATGAGKVFGSILAKEWAPGSWAIGFGEGASEVVVGDVEPAPAKELYYNRVSEVWGVGKEYLLQEKLTGISPEMAMEMTCRYYEEVKRGDKLVVKAEPKPKMKTRLQKSPDIADSGFMLLDLARSRFDFNSDNGRITQSNSAIQKAWTNQAKHMDITARTRNNLGLIS